VAAFGWLFDTVIFHLKKTDKLILSVFKLITPKKKKNSNSGPRLIKKTRISTSTKKQFQLNNCCTLLVTPRQAGLMLARII
jgi:hypothetical protein